MSPAEFNFRRHDEAVVTFSSDLLFCVSDAEAARTYRMKKKKKRMKRKKREEKGKEKYWPCRRPPQGDVALQRREK